MQKLIYGESTIGEIVITVNEIIDHIQGQGVSNESPARDVDCGELSVDCDHCGYKRHYKVTPNSDKGNGS